RIEVHYACIMRFDAKFAQNYSVNRMLEQCLNEAAGVVGCPGHGTDPKYPVERVQARAKTAFSAPVSRRDPRWVTSLGTRDPHWVTRSKPGHPDARPPWVTSLGPPAPRLAPA